MKKVYLSRAKAQIARPVTIRSINRQIVLNYIRDSNPISRAEIARETTLNRSTVSSIVDSLIQDGLTEEIGIGDSSGGRKPTLLKLKSGKPVAVGVDITPKLTTIAVADLSGKILESMEFLTICEVEKMSEEIVERVVRLLQVYNNNELCIGISVPGITDSASGNVIYVPYFQWRNWDICSRLSKATNLNVSIENDANASALAELWFGKKNIRNYKDIVTILVGEGIGTGIVFDGQIYRGERGTAGEFGHMIVGENAPVDCSCGSRNCWEAMASEKATIARYSQMSHEKNGNHQMSIKNLVDLAKSGNQNALDALKQTSKFLGIGISNLIVGLNPQAIILSGSIIEAWDIISNDLLSILEKNNRIGSATTHLTTSTLGNRPTLIGALNLVLARKFVTI